MTKRQRILLKLATMLLFVLLLVVFASPTVDFVYRAF